MRYKSRFFGQETAWLKKSILRRPFVEFYYHIAGAGPVPVRIPNGPMQLICQCVAFRVADGHRGRPCTSAVLVTNAFYFFTSLRPLCMYTQWLGVLTRCPESV